MKSLILFATLTIQAVAQTNTPSKPTTVRGTMEIKYNSRVTPGASDVYSLDLNVDNSAVFRGHITNTPPVLSNSIFSGETVKRQSQLNYQLNCAVVNPKNPEQTMTIGRLYGTVPITTSGTYDYGRGTLKVGINAMGRATAFDSKYTGTASGKPIVKLKGGLTSRIRQESLKIQRKVGGQTVSITVTNYDKMVFTSHKMGAGPIQYYPESTVNGEMAYDYDRYAWIFNGLSIVYPMDGVQKQDTISGNIRWIEQPKKGASRLGEYQFDVRVNELIAQSATFASAATEDSFFQTDDTIAALVGAMKYADQFAGEKVTASQVTIELTGQKLNRQQTMNLTKLILLSAIVPLNAE